MSTLKVNTIQHSNGTNAMTIDSSGNAAFSGVVTGTPLGNRNLIINGDMRIAQRGTSLTSIAGSGYYSVDRFIMNINAGYANIASIQQNLNSISPPTDFTNYVGITIDTATTPDAQASKQFFNFRQQIEQHIINYLNFGTANAKTITVSFWVRSSLTGTFAFSLRNGASDRSYVTTYTINSADTWEKKTITINGDTTGTWNQAENVLGMTVNWGHGHTAPYLTSTINEWQDGSLTGYTSQVNLVETQNATWYITGVQLEVGENATEFEHRPYDMELARCQRYYTRIGGNPSSSLTASRTLLGLGYSGTSTQITTSVSLPTIMRSQPTVNYGGTLLASGYNYSTAVSSVSFNQGGNLFNISVLANVSSTTVNLPRSILVRTDLDADSYVDFNAEL